MMVKLKKTFVLQRAARNKQRPRYISCFVFISGKKSLSWRNCVGICTDGAPPMVGSMRCFTCLVKNEGPDVVTTPCFLCREVLVSKALGDGMIKVLDAATNKVDFIK
jgi:hypothetical protein